MKNDLTSALIERVKQMPWGTVNGQLVSLYQLSNNKGTKMVVTNYGATIQSLLVKDKNGNTDDVVLGYDDLENYVNDPYYIGSIVGRYANRISSGTIYINGKAFNIHTTEGGYHLHGGKTGFNKKVWSAEAVENHDKCGVRLCYLSVDGEEGFPGNLEVQVTYWLTNNNEVVVEYEASSDKTTLINLTQHSYFNLAGHQENSALGHYLQIPALWYLPVNKMQVPNGDIAEVKGTPFDFSLSKKVEADILQENMQLALSSGYDHSWVLEKKHTEALKHAARLSEPASGRILDVYTTEPAVHFYSANFIESGTKGKKGAIYSKRNSICLETQHFPDAPNNPHFPSTILSAGDSFYSKTIFKFSTE